MGRLKIELPGKKHFITEIRIRISDINYAGHLSNEVILSYAHEVRLQFLHSLGYSEKDVEGTGLIMSDAAVVYKSEGFLGEILTVAVTVGEITRVGFDMYFLFTEKQTGREIARAKTGMTFFSYTNRKIASTPAGFESKINSIS